MLIFLKNCAVQTIFEIFFKVLLGNLPMSWFVCQNITQKVNSLLAFMLRATLTQLNNISVSNQLTTKLLLSLWSLLWPLTPSK